MARKRYAADEIIGHLRTIEIKLGKGLAIMEICRKPGSTEQLRDELLNGELFYTLPEAQAIIEAWRVDYNTRHPHNSLGRLTPSEFITQRHLQDSPCLAVHPKPGWHLFRHLQVGQS